MDVIGLLSRCEVGGPTKPAAAPAPTPAPIPLPTRPPPIPPTPQPPAGGVPMRIAAPAQPQPQPMININTYPGQPGAQADNTPINPALIPTNRNDPNKLRVMLCGTYPIGQSNGYSRVVYYIAKHLGKKEDIQLTIYGFQNFGQTAGAAETRKDIPATVILHDALATESPRRSGFGEREIAEYIRKNPQDIVIIFNDMVITSACTQTIVNGMSLEERKRFKLVSYMDQVYPYQKKQFIEILNHCYDAVITFTPYWKEVSQVVGVRKGMPTYFFPHGFDYKLYYPIPRRLARLYFDLPQDAFVVLQLNRNQPRKRLDLTMMAWAEVVRRHITEKKTRPMRLMLGTQLDGYWDLMDLYEDQLRRFGIGMEEGKKYVVSVARPQQLSDRDINILYNACDVGLNTCEGEGFGLCQFEHAAIGCPQVAPSIGGFREFLNKENSIPVEPKLQYYIDKHRDGIGGIAEVAPHMDYANALWRYYTNPSLVTKHGMRARRDILQHYRWESMVEDHFYNVIKQIRDGPQTAPMLNVPAKS